MPTIDINDDITPYYSDPMYNKLIIMHTVGDDYYNSKSCGKQLTKLHKDLQRLDFPYFFVKIITTNANIEFELDTLRKMYSSESDIVEFEIVNGDFQKKVYHGDTYCVYPWIHKYVNPQGLVMPCCVGNENYPLGNIKEKSLDDITTEEIQQQMLKGERPDACSTCWIKEDLGITSQRIRVNKSWKKYNKQKDFVLRHLDIRLSNKCNLMCRMCSGKFSNRIANEEEKLYGFTKYKNELLSKDLVNEQLSYIEKNLDTVESVYFAGGEPLINQEHYNILELLIKHKKTDISIQYNTNFSTLKFKKYDVLDLWKNFKNVNIGASIDLIGKQSDYVRHGVDYNILEKNYNLIKNQKNINFQITSILHLMNIFNLPELQKHWINLGLNCNQIDFELLIDPTEQSITVLPTDYKNIAVEQIQNHIEYLKSVPNSENLIDKWQEFTKIMLDNNNSHLLKDFFKLNDDKDQARNQVFENYFPEYINLRKYI